MAGALATADVQRQIRRHRSLRAVSAGGAVGPVISAVMIIVAAHSVLAAWPSVAMALICAAWAAREQRVLRRLQGELAALTVPAARPKTRAEEPAEAVEALRQRQWDAIAERAYRAMGGPGRATPAPASKPPMTALPPARTLPVTDTTTMAEFTAGIARLSAAAGGCAHPDAEPVDLITGERVAWVCPDCPANLPANWRP